MFRRLLALGVLLAVPAVSAAGPSLTIYSHDLGWVRETRPVSLRGARDTLRFGYVSNRLDPSSVQVEVPGARVTRLAYRWDVATGDDLLARAPGQRVRVVSKGERVTEGVLLSADGAWLVVSADDGSVSTLARDAVTEVRLARPDPGLSLSPTIEAAVEGGRAGSASASLAYLTGGLSWTAEHTLERTGETTAEWTTRVRVENTTGRPYADARVKLIAGEPSRIASPELKPELMRANAMAIGVAGAPQAEMGEQAFADYHLYTLDAPVTLRDREAQTLVMVGTKRIAVIPRYLFRGGDPRGIATQLRVVNAEGRGPGVPLPAGRVRTFAPDDANDLQFTGESAIGHVAVGETLTVELGRAFDLVAERRELSSRRVSDREREYTVEIALRNHKPADATIEVEEPAGGDVEVVSSTLPVTRKDASTIAFTVPVPAGRTVALRYTARQRW